MTSKAAIKRGEANKTASPSKSARDPLLSSLALLLKHPVAKMLLIAVLCVLLLVASPVQSLSDETTAMRYMVKAGTAPEMAMMMAPPQMEEFEDNGMDARSYEMLDGSGIGKVVSDEMKDAMQGLEGKTYPTARMLVREGHLSLETPVGSLAERIQQIEAIMAEDSEAYVESQSQFDDWDHGHRGSGSKRVQGYRLTLRIPSDSYDTSVQFLRDLVGEGSVVNWSTDAYVDASSRADVLQASRQALQTLLQEAKQVKEVLEIQRELNRLVEAYESQKNRAQRLQKQSSFSTLVVELREKFPDPPMFQKKLEGFLPVQMVQLAAKHLCRVTSQLANAAVYYATLVLPIAFVLLMLWYLCKPTVDRYKVRNETLYS